MSKPGPVEYEYVARFGRAIDGDTVVLLTDLGFHVLLEVEVRLNGLDCPELTTPEGQQALSYTRRWCSRHHHLRLRSHKTEKYGRWLGDISDPETGESLNEVLLRKGLAVPYDGGKRASEATGMEPIVQPMNFG